MISYLKTKNKYFFFILLLVFIYIGQYLDRFEKEDIIYFKEVKYDFENLKLQKYNYIFFENALKTNKDYHATIYARNVKRRPYVGGNLLNLPCSLEYNYNNSSKYPDTFKHILTYSVVFYNHNHELEKQCVNEIEKIHMWIFKHLSNLSKETIFEFLPECIKKKNYVIWYPFLSREECNKILTNYYDIITTDTLKQKINFNSLDLILNNLTYNYEQIYNFQNILVLISFRKFFSDFNLMISKSLIEEFSKVDIKRKSEKRSLVSANKYTILLIYLFVFLFIFINKKNFKIKTKL